MEARGVIVAEFDDPCRFPHRVIAAEFGDPCRASVLREFGTGVKWPALWPARKKYCFQFWAVDCLIGWRLFYLSFAQAGREGEKGVHLRMVLNDHLTSQLRIRAVAWYQ